MKYATLDGALSALGGGGDAGRCHPAPDKSARADDPRLGRFPGGISRVPKRASKAWARVGWVPKRARSLIRPEGGLRVPVMLVLGLLGLWASSLG